MDGSQHIGADVDESFKHIVLSKYEDEAKSKFSGDAASQFTLLRKVVGVKLELSLSDHTSISLDTADGKYRLLLYQ